MGKRVKPKGKNPRKQPKSRGSDMDPNGDQSASTPETTNEEETSKTREGCSHYTKGDAHLNKVLLEILSSNNEFSSCDHCRDESPQINRKGGAGGGKKKKKGGAGPKGGGAKSNMNTIWVCLDCGRSFCGGEVNKEVPYGHARRHAKQERHNWAVGPTSSGTAWCFLCDSEVPIEMPSIEENALSTSKLTAEPDYTKAMKSDAKQESVSFHTGPYQHSIRGLSNLGNTCFFNSVLQNLLALKMLRVSLVNPRNSDPDNDVAFVTSPLTMSLRKLFLETNGGEDCRGILSPKNLFGNICAKAPQFRGYQQHDSHELLRCLLDVLNTEETSARKSKQADSGKEDGSGTAGPTLVDSMFSGRLSSAISCLECGHTSVVHEPFLDLSLPVPAKKKGTTAKKGGNRPSLARGRGRSVRSRDRPVSISSPVDKQTRKHEDATENTSFKTAGETESTVSKPGEMPDPKSTSVEAGADAEDVVVSKLEVEGSGACPDSMTADMADSSWMDFLVDQENAATVQGHSETESIGPEVLGSDSIAPELGSETTDTAAVEAGPEVEVDAECKIRFESTLQELESVKREAIDSESTVIGQALEGPQTESSKGDMSCFAVAVGLKNIAVGPSCSMEFTDSTNGFVEKAENEFSTHDSSLSVVSDKQVPHCAEKLGKSDSAVSKMNAVGDPDLLQNQRDDPRSVASDANALSSFIHSDEQELIPKADIAKGDGGDGWLPDESGGVDDKVVKANIGADLDLLYNQDDELNGMVLKADVHDDMNWLMDEGSDICSTAVEKRVHADSQAESYELESTVVRMDGYVPGNVAFKESSSLCTDISSSSSKPASPNQRLTSIHPDPCGDSITSDLPDSTPTKEESDACSIMQESAKTEMDGDTDTAVTLHPSEEKNVTKMALTTVNAGTEMHQEEEFEGFGDMFNEPEETVGPVNGPNPKPEDDDDADSVFWGSGGAFSGFGFNSEEVDDTDKPVSVVSCLELFTKPELLTGEHAWHCEKCSELQNNNANDKDCPKGDREKKVMRDAMKRYMVDRAPQVLTVHLKRFSQDARSRLSKLRGHVKFEEILDLTSYIHPRSNDKDKCMYQLVGLVEHSGNMSGGHYVAYIRGEKTLKGGVYGHAWFYASDAHVKEVSLSEVLRSEAYLLFYERVKDENSS